LLLLLRCTLALGAGEQPTIARLHSSHGQKHTVNDAPRMGWAAWNIDIDRKNLVGAVCFCVATAVHATRNCAGTGGNYCPRLGHRIVTTPESGLHTLAHRAGYNQSIGKAGRGDHMNPKSINVENGISGSTNLRVASAAARRHHPGMYRFREWIRLAPGCGSLTFPRLN